MGVDFNTALQQQTEANRGNAFLQAGLNNPATLTTPYGTQTTTRDPTTGQTDVNQSLAPAEQAKLDAGNLFQQNVLTGLGGVDINALLQGAFNAGGTGGGGGGGGSFPGGVFGAGAVGDGTGVTDKSGSWADQSGAGKVPVGSLDFSGAPVMPGADTGVRDQVIDSLYNQGARFLDPQFANAQSGLEAQLANQGIVRNADPNSAFGTEMDALGRTKTLAYGDLRDRSILAGGNAMEQLFNMGLGARKQGVSEITGQGQFANAAQGQQVGQILSALTGQTGAANDATNAAANMSSANAANTAAGASQISAGAAARNANTNAAGLPLQYIMGLAGLGQVNNPTFQNPLTPTTIAKDESLLAAQNQGQLEAANKNSRNNLIGNIVKVGLPLLGTIFSDRRLKSNIVPVGKGPLGLTLYEYNIFDRREQGVMADEVEQVMPAAVELGADGFKRVNYTMIGMPNGPRQKH